MLAHSLQSLTKRGLGSRSFLYEEIGARRLRARKMGRRTVILDPDLQDWLASLPEAQVRAYRRQDRPRMKRKRQRKARASVDHAPAV